MKWQDQGIVVGARRHGETSVILEVMTREHGRHLGLVRSGASRRMQPLLQAGNAVEVTWQARLDEHLGFYLVEATQLRAAVLMETAMALHGLNHLAGLLRLLAEREPHTHLYEMARVVLAQLDRTDGASALMVWFETALLAESGFGIDLRQCAATGSRIDLAYVSPKSGRAVSRAAGEPYRDRLLPLPSFLLADPDDLQALDDVSPEATRQGFDLTGYFLARDIYAPRGLPLPDARSAYLAQLDARAKTAGVNDQ